MSRFMMNMRTLVLGLAGFAVLWSCAVVFIYLLTLDETILSGWLDVPSLPVWLFFGVLAISQFVFRTALVVGAVILWTQGRRRVLDGFLVGLAFALWASAAFLVIPYCAGTYLSLPGLIVGAALSGWTNAGVWYVVGMLTVNLVFWSCAVAFFYYLIAPVWRLAGETRRS
jgi:hypothetical protein